MYKVIGSVAAATLVALASALGLVYSGTVSVAATDPHWAITDWILQTARTRSIKAHAAGFAPPFALDDEQRILVGADHYADHCANCHSAPGLSETALGRSLSPKSPELTGVSRRYSPGELFWIVKNGIRMTGMPSWASHGDTELWSIVAFLEKLPALSPEDYERLVAAAATDPHSHHDHGEPLEHESHSGHQH